MTTPTLAHLMVWEPQDDGSQQRPATTADLRAVLLEHGAEERQWCETHDDFAIRHLGESCRWSLKVLANRPRVPCRMVSVLVWRGGEQQ